MMHMATTASMHVPMNHSASMESSSFQIVPTGASVQSAEEKPKEDRHHVLSVWEKKKSSTDGGTEDEAKPTSSNFSGGRQDMSPARMSTFEEDNVAVTKAAGSPCARIILHPNSRKRIAWDLSELALVVYDAAMIPMGLFSLPDDIFLKFMEWFSRIFWTLDMGMSSLTAVILKDGNVNKNHKFILKRYLKTWFSLDMLIVGSDWMGFLASSGGVASLASASRAFRIIRIVRLVRLVKLAGVMEKGTEKLQSYKSAGDKLMFGIIIIKMLMVVIFFSHFAACIWWGIGDSDRDRTWVKTFKWNERPVGEQYLVSLHWSMSQLAGGMDEVTPQNGSERFFGVFVFLMGLFIMLVLIAIATSKLTQLAIIRGSMAQKVNNLKKYMQQNGISSNLALRVQRNVQFALSGDLSPEAVELLPIVSRPLQVELHMEMYAPAVQTIPFFTLCGQECPQILKKICHRAMSHTLLEKGYTVFVEGESATAMYIVVKGQLTYDHEDMIRNVDEKNWVAEPVLWTSWWHRGILTAKNEVKLTALDSEEFHDIVGPFNGTTSFNPKNYAAEFVAHMNDCAEVNVDDLICLSKSRSTYHEPVKKQSMSNTLGATFSKVKSLTGVE